MKRFLHALAALWPKRKEVGNPPAPPTSSGLRQHLAAVLRIEGYLSECTDIHSRKPNGLTSDTHPARREVERSVSTVNRPERSDVPTRATVGIDSPNQQFVESPNQPQSLPRIPQPMPLLTILMLVFFMCLMAAPSRAIGTAAFLDSIPESAIRPLKIGDTIPEELWHLPLQVVNHPEGKETITLNDYRGKLIILDFWSTWCKPCLESLDKLDAIRDSAFQDELAIVPVQALDSERRAIAFIERNNWKRYSVVNDEALHSIAFSRYLTGFGTVWISDNILYAIPSYEDISTDTIRKVIKALPVNMENQPVRTSNTMITSN